MFIARGMHQISQSPRGATCEQSTKDTHHGRYYIQPYMHILNWKPSFVIFKIRRSIIRVRRSGKNISRF